MTYPAGIVSAGYDRLAERWDDWAATVTPDLRLEYVDIVSATLSPEDRVLELGCGTGRPVAEVLAPLCRYRGVDLSPEMVRIAASRVPDGTFAVADMRALEVPDSTLAAVVAFYSIIHIPRDQHRRLFERILGWLAPRGLLVATLTGRDDSEGYEEQWLEAGPMFWSGWEPAKAIDELSDLGFTIEDARTRPQMEGDEPVEFLWVVARRPS